MAATSYMWLLKSKLILFKQNLKFSFSTTLASLQVFSAHKWLVAVVLDSADVKHFHHTIAITFHVLEGTFGIKVVPVISVL